MKVLIVTKINDVFNPKIYGSIKSIWENEHICKHNLKMSHRSLLAALKDKDSWNNQEYFIKKEEIIRTKNKN